MGQQAVWYEVRCSWCSDTRAELGCRNEGEALPRLRRAGWRKDEGGAWLCPACVAEVERLSDERLSGLAEVDTYA